MGGAACDRDPEEQRNGAGIMLKEGKAEYRFQRTDGQAAVGASRQWTRCLDLLQPGGGAARDAVKASPGESRCLFSRQIPAKGRKIQRQTLEVWRQQSKRFAFTFSFFHQPGTVTVDSERGSRRSAVAPAAPLYPAAPPPPPPASQSRE